MEGTDHSVTTWRKSTYSSANGGNRVEVGAWRKSTYSGGNGSNCVEVGEWRKSTYSGSNGSDCVEVGGSDPVVMVRDTKDRAGAALTFGPAAWRRFAATIKSTARA